MPLLLVPILALATSGQTGRVPQRSIAERLFVIESLRQSHDETDIQRLSDMEEDEDFGVCTKAEEALEARLRFILDAIARRMDGVACRPDLDALREEIERYCKLTGFSSGGRYRGRLLREGHDPNVVVREQLIIDIALDGKYEDDDAPEVPWGDCCGGSSISAAFSRAVELSPDAIIPLLKRDDVHFKARLLYALPGVLSDNAKSIAVKLASAPLCETRSAAIYALRLADGLQVETAILKSAKDSALRVRFAAVAGLKGRAIPEAEAALCALCLDSDSSVWRKAVEALPPESTPHIRETLAKMLRSPDSDMRQGACESTGSRGEVLLRPLLIKALSDPSNGVAIAARAALENLVSPP